jgi:hypothetical protein
MNKTNPPSTGDVPGEAPVYQSPLDWRLLGYHSFSTLDQLARLVVERDLVDDARDYVLASRRHAWMRPGHLLGRICLLAGKDQIAAFTPIVEDLTCMKGQDKDSLGTLLVAHYLLLERWNDTRGIDRAFAIWLRERQIGRLRPELWLPLMRGEQEDRWTDAHNLPVRYPILQGHDATMEEKVDGLVRSDSFDELASMLESLTRRRDRGVAASLLLSYVFRHCSAGQVAKAVYLVDEFMPSCAPRRRLQVLNDLCLAHIRLGAREGYAACFLKVGRWRQSRLLPPYAGLSPLSFDYLRGRNPAGGNMIWRFGLV